MKTLFQKIRDHHVGMLNSVRIIVSFLILASLVIPHFSSLKSTQAGTISATWDTTKFLDQSFWNDNPVAVDIKRAVFGTTGGVSSTAYTTGWTTPGACTGSTSIVAVSTTINQSSLDTINSNTIYILEPGDYVRNQSIIANGVSCFAIVAKPGVKMIFNGITGFISNSSSGFVIDGVLISGSSVGIQISGMNSQNISFNEISLDKNAWGVYVSNTFLSNFLIHKSRLIGNNQGAISFNALSSGFIVLNSLFLNNNNAFSSFGSIQNYAFINNVFMNNTGVGISLLQSMNGKIANNIISNHSSYGMRFVGGSTGNIVSNNSFSNNEGGIFYDGVLFDEHIIGNYFMNNSGVSVLLSGGNISYYGQNYSFSSGGDFASTGTIIGSPLASSHITLDSFYGSTIWYGTNFGTNWTQNINCNWMVNAINSQGQTLFALNSCNDSNFNWSSIRGVRPWIGDIDTKIIVGKSIQNQKQPFQRSLGTFTLFSSTPFNSQMSIGDGVSMGGSIKPALNPNFFAGIPVIGGQTFTVDLWQQGYTNYEIVGDINPVNGSINSNMITSIPLTFAGGNGLKTVRVRYTKGNLSSNRYQMTVNFQDLLANVNATLPGNTSTTGTTLTLTTDRSIAYQVTGDVVGIISGVTAVSTGLNIIVTPTSGMKYMTVTLSSGGFSRIFNMSILYSTSISLSPVDLEVTSLVSDTTLRRGDTLSFNITYRNRGTTPATNVILTFTGSSLLRDVTSNIANTRTNNTLFFNLGTLNSGAVGSILINSTVGAGSPGNRVSNTIGITGDQEDSNTNNNTVLLNSQIYNSNSTTHNSASNDPLDVIQQLYDINNTLIGQLPSSVPISNDTANNSYRSSIDTVLRYGVMRGYKFRSGRVAFSPNKSISVCEWNSIVDRMINLNGNVVSATNHSSCKNPRVGNKVISQLQAQQILEERMGSAGHGSAQVEDLFDGSSMMTRGEAAHILVGAFRFEKDFLIGQNHQFMNMVYSKLQSRNIEQRRQFVNRLIQKINQFNEEELSKIGLDKVKLIGDLTDSLNGVRRSRSTNGTVQSNFDDLFTGF